MDYDKKLELIEIKTTELIKSLNLQISDNIKIQLDNCCKLQKYIVMNNKYDSSLIKSNNCILPEEVIINELYEALINKRVVCTTNSILFTHIISKLGIEVYNVSTFFKTNNKYHMANIVRLNKKYYIFDSTLDKGLYILKNNNRLKRAGMGYKKSNNLYYISRVYDNDFNIKQIDINDIARVNISQIKLLKYNYKH